MNIENHRTWKLYLLVRNQLLRAGMDGTVVGLNLQAVCAILKFYNEGEHRLEEILMLWSIEQELKIE